MKALQGYRDLSRRTKRALAWDVFMVWVAVINLSLILFDLSYLWLRPTYFHYLPVVTRIYDPVKGIESHPLTRSLLDEVETTQELVQRDLGSPELAAHVASLRELTLRVFRENPFERSGQSELLGVLKQKLADSTGVPRSRPRRARLAPHLDEHVVLALARDLLGSAARRKLNMRTTLFVSLRPPRTCHPCGTAGGEPGLGIEFFDLVAHVEPMAIEEMINVPLRV